MALLTIHPLYAEENDAVSSHIHFLTAGPNEGRDKYLRIAILKYDEIYALRIDEIKRDILNDKNEKRAASVNQDNHSYAIDMMPDKCGSGRKIDSCLEDIRKRRSWVWVSITGRDRKIEGWVLHEGGPLISIESCNLC